MGVLPASTTDPDVLAFIARFYLAGPAQLVPYQPHGYAAIQCHVSAKVHAIKNGGKRVHGWSLWRFPAGLMGEFHSVWEPVGRPVIDLTPPRFGGNQTMFVRDSVADIKAINGNAFMQPNNRMPPPHAPFWKDGHPTNETDMGFLETAPSFADYCATVGLAVSDYATDPTHG